MCGSGIVSNVLQGSIGVNPDTVSCVLVDSIVCVLSSEKIVLPDGDGMHAVPRRQRESAVEVRSSFGTVARQPA